MRYNGYIMSCDPVEGDMAISHLIFLNSRTKKCKNSTNLVANGPAGTYYNYLYFTLNIINDIGCVHFWNVNNTHAPAGYWVAVSQDIHFMN